MKRHGSRVICFDFFIAGCTRVYTAVYSDVRIRTLRTVNQSTSRGNNNNNKRAKNLLYGFIPLKPETKIENQATKKKNKNGVRGNVHHYKEFLPRVLVMFID